MFSKVKWICGIGNMLIHFCNYCHTPYSTKDEAVICEMDCESKKIDFGNRNWFRNLSEKLLRDIEKTRCIT